MFGVCNLFKKLTLIQKGCIQLIKCEEFYIVIIVYYRQTAWFIMSFAL